MPSLKEYKAKINSLTNTKKMTKTMKLVSASKLRAVQNLQINAKNYFQHIGEIMARVAASMERTRHPLLRSHTKVDSALLVIFTSDRGLAGGFNNNLQRKAFAWIKENKDVYSQIEVVNIGRRGYTFFKNRATVRRYYEDASSKFNYTLTQSIANDIAGWFLKGDFKHVYLVYNRFISPLSQIPTIEKVLPIEAADLPLKKEAKSVDYIFEPNSAVLLHKLIFEYCNFRLFFTFVENAIGEHGARMMAMDNATENASDLISRYTLLRNRARQAAITKELIEIISGAEALK